MQLEEKIQKGFKYPLTIFPQMVTSFMTIVEYHKQEVDVNAIHWPYLDLTIFTCALVYVCMCVFSSIILITCIDLCDTSTGKVQSSPITKIPGATLIYHTVLWPEMLPSLQHNLVSYWKLLICSPFLCFCHLYYINGIIRFGTFWDWGCFLLTFIP